jgi:hypothetical protein
VLEVKLFESKKVFLLNQTTFQNFLFSWLIRVITISHYYWIRIKISFMPNPRFSKEDKIIQGNSSCSYLSFLFDVVYCV